MKKEPVTVEQLEYLKNNYTIDIEKTNALVDEYWKDLIIQKLIDEGRLRNKKDIKYFDLKREAYENGDVKYTARIVPISAVENIEMTLLFE